MNLVPHRLTYKDNNIILIAPANMQFPESNIFLLDSCCGAGEFGDKIIPDSILGVSISGACYIHDKMWNIDTPNWDHFHASNSVFLHNMLRIVTCVSGNSFIKGLRTHIAVSYYNTVDLSGMYFYFKSKNKIT